MGTHALLIALVAISPAGSPESHSKSAAVSAAKSDGTERSPQQLRQAVRSALRRQATAPSAEQKSALQDLADVYGELAASTRLTPAERMELGGIVRSRLARSGQALKRRLAKIEVDPERTVLAQVRGNAPQARPTAGGGTGGAGQVLADMTAQNAQQLIDLIETTIAPGSWDMRGGPGTIVYFAPKMVLVANQTDAVHEQLGPFLNALRGQ